MGNHRKNEKENNITKLLEVDKKYCKAVNKPSFEGTSLSLRKLSDSASYPESKNRKIQSVKDRKAVYKKFTTESVANAPIFLPWYYFPENPDLRYLKRRSLISSGDDFGQLQQDDGFKDRFGISDLENMSRRVSNTRLKKLSEPLGFANPMRKLVIADTPPLHLVYPTSSYGEHSGDPIQKMMPVYYLSGPMAAPSLRPPFTFGTFDPRRALSRLQTVDVSRGAEKENDAVSNYSSSSSSNTFIIRTS